MKLITIDASSHFHTGAIVGAEALDFAFCGDEWAMANWIPMDMRALLAGGERALDLLRAFVASPVESIIWVDPAELERLTASHCSPPPRTASSAAPPRKRST